MKDTLYVRVSSAFVLARTIEQLQKAAMDFKEELDSSDDEIAKVWLRNSYKYNRARIVKRGTAPNKKAEVVASTFE